MKRALPRKSKKLTETIFSINDKRCAGEKIFDIFYANKNII